MVDPGLQALAEGDKKLLSTAFRIARDFDSVKAHLGADFLVIEAKTTTL
jgi:hypothetical protein